MTVYETWDFFRTIREEKREGSKRGKKGWSWVGYYWDDEYMEFIMLFSLLLYLFEIFFDKRVIRGNVAPWNAIDFNGGLKKKIRDRLTLF